MLAFFRLFLLLLGLFPNPLLGRSPATYRTGAQIMVAGRAIFPPEKDDL